MSLDDEEVTITLTIPENFHDRNASFQINKLNTSGFSAPSGKQLVRNHLFSLIAVDEDEEKITNFDQAITFVVQYEASLVEEIDEDTLDVYFYDAGTWVAQNCVLDKTTRTLTCSLSHFSVYAVFGDPYTTSTTVTTSGASTAPSSNPVDTAYCDPTWLGIPHLFQIDTTRDTATVYFTPVAESSEYYISYSTQPSAEEHGVQVTLGTEGVQSFQIKELLVSSTYYFKVRAIKGCAFGDWSNIKEASTTPPVIQANNLNPYSLPKVTPTPTAIPTPISDSAPEQMVDAVSDLHDLLIRVEEQGKPVGGVVVDIPEIGQAVTNERGEVRFERVRAGKQTFKLFRDAYASDHEIEVRGPEKEFSVLVKITPTTNLFPDWLWALIVALLVGLLLWKRKNKK